MNPIPGQFHCPKCKFQLSKMILFAKDGSSAPDAWAEPELCPNDGTLMQQCFEKPDDKLVAVDEYGFGVGWYYRADPSQVFKFSDQEIEA